MEIDNWVSLSLILLLLSLNLFIYFTLDPQIGLRINDNFSYVPFDNFYLALILALIFLLIVLISREKAMGAGDIRIALIVGLLIGQSNAIIWLYITVFSALIYGLILGYKKKKFRKLKIPFAPFMILGAVLSLLIDMYS
jgi:leader peptidase (prepilin peptidase)/N-methyltransferase